MKLILQLLLFILLSYSNLYSQENKLKIGVLVSLSGDSAQNGKNIQNGIELAKSELSTEIAERIIIDYQDTDEEKSRAKVLSAYKHLKSRNFKVFIGPTGIPGAKTVSTIKDDIVLLAPTSTNSFHKSSDNFYNIGGDNYHTTKAIAEYAYNNDKIKKIAIFSSTQP